MKGPTIVSNKKIFLKYILKNKIQSHHTNHFYYY